MTIKNISISSDWIGVLSSGLCMIHCIATPFIFIAKSCSTSCCASAPAEWAALDYLFIGISFIAVYFSTKNTSKEWIKYALWISWIVSLLAIINASIVWIGIPEQSFYIPAVTLIGLHLYNSKYCKCDNDNCHLHN